MANFHVDDVIKEFEKLEVVDQIAVLRHIHKSQPHRYDFATQCEPLQYFHTANKSRGI